MPDQPISPIPPGPDGGCPQGYALSTVDNMCYLVAPPIQVTSTGVSLPDVDPRNAGTLTGLGLGDSSLPERMALAHWHTLKKSAPTAVLSAAKGVHAIGEFLGDILSPFVWAYLSVYDVLVSVIAGWLTASKTRDNPFFWQTIGEVISDLLGIELDGIALYESMKSRGTVAAMQGVGAGLINLLIGEFTGTATGQNGQVSFSSAVNATTGLPEATLTPKGGVDAAQALMGFVLSSSVRQANIEGLTDQIPYGFGHIFEKYSEAMRTNLGIGRMLRFALRPIMGLVADQLKWAINLQYRPKLLNPAEAARAFLSEVYTQEEYLAECAMGDGLSDRRALSVLDQHTRRPALNELLILRAAGLLDDTQFDRYLKRDGFDAVSAGAVRTAHDLEPARRVSLAVAEHQLLQYAQGLITGQALKDFIETLKSQGFFLTPGEVTALESVATRITANVKLRPRHLSVGQLKKAYIDGTITLQEYEDHLTALGYSESDVQILGIEVLIDAKHAQEAAAKHAAAAKKGKGPATSPTLAPGGAPGT